MSLKFIWSDTQICWIFLLKNVSSFCRTTHIFSAKNIGILYIESAKTVNEMTLNELVKLTMLSTIGPRSIVFILPSDRIKMCACMCSTWIHSYEGPAAENLWTLSINTQKKINGDIEKLERMQFYSVNRGLIARLLQVRWLFFPILNLLTMEALWRLQHFFL